MFFTNKGRVYKLKAYEIPEASRTARGIAIVNILQLMAEEKITAVIPVDNFEDNQYLFMATKKGMVKKTRINEFANIRKTGIQAISFHGEDDLIEVKVTDGSKQILLVTKNGLCIRFSEGDVRSTGRTSMGVIGINLSYDDEVVGMQLDTQGRDMLIVSEKGLGKRTDINEFNIQRRGGKGVKCYKITEKSGNVVGAKIVDDSREMLLITNEGIVIRISVNDISVLGRNTSGVKVMNIDADSNIVIAGIAKVRDEDPEENVDAASEDNENIAENESE